jgi:hypothetical protein
MLYHRYQHSHVSEREAKHRWPDGQWDNKSWEDCLWASAVEALRFGGLRIQATLAEAELIRAASGEPPTGPSNQGNLAAGTRARFGLDLTQGSGFNELWSALKPGTAAVVNGRLGAFRAGHRLRRHLPPYADGHAIAAFRLERDDRVWWCDPLAPAGFGGEVVTRSELASYAGAGGQFTVVRYGQFAPVLPQERAMIRTNFAGVPVGIAVTTHAASAFDMETGLPRPIPEGYRRNVVMEVRLAEKLSKSLRVGEPMLVTTIGDPDRYELIRASDTDWPAGRRTA